MHVWLLDNLAFTARPPLAMLAFGRKVDGNRLVLGVARLKVCALYGILFCCNTVYTGVAAVFDRKLSSRLHDF